MKLYHPDGTGCSWQGLSFEADEDGAIEVPNEAAADLIPHGWTTAKPGAPAPAPSFLQHHDDETTGEDVLTRLAHAKKSEIVAYAAQVYGLELDPSTKKDDLLLAVAEAAAKAAEAAKQKAEEEAAAAAALEQKLARIAELEGKGELTAEEAEELAALKADESEDKE